MTQNEQDKLLKIFFYLVNFHRQQSELNTTITMARGMLRARDRLRGGSLQTVEQVQRGGVQVKSEEVGLDSIIAQAVGHQFAFEFLVSVLGHRRFGGRPRSAYSS